MRFLAAILLCLGSVATSVATDWRVTWFPGDATFRSWPDVFVASGIEFRPLAPSPKEPRGWSFGIDPLDSGTPVSISFQDRGLIDSRGWSYFHNRPLPIEALHAFDTLGEGTFLCAVRAEGQRCSNVCRIAIHHDYDVSQAPEIRLFPLEPIEGDLFTDVGVSFMPKAHDITNFWPDLEVNGQWRLGSELPWSGPVKPLRVGVLYAFTFGLPGKGLPAGTILRARPDIIPAIQGQPPRSVVSPPLTLALHPADADAFDRAFQGKENSR